MSEQPVFNGESIILAPCPASIWLLGSVAQCSLAKDHDKGPQATNHKVTIEWSIRLCTSRWASHPASLTT